MSFVEYVLFQLKDIDESELTTAEENILKEAKIELEIQKEDQGDRPK